MKVTLEKLPASQIGFDIQVEGAKSQAIYDRIVKDLTRTIQVPGFRKGKAPKQLVLRQVGTDRIRVNVLEELIEKALEEALKENKEVQEKALGNFELVSDLTELVVGFVPGQEISFKAAIDVDPEVTLPRHKGFTVQAEEIKPDFAKVDSTLHSFQVRKSTLVPVEDRPIQVDDVATIDLKVIDLETGEPIEDAGEEDFQLDVNEKAFIPEVVRAIIGANLDQVIELESTFPEEYYPEEYVGKPIRYVITIKTIKGRELPALDDEFAQSISDKQTIAELRELLETQVIEEAESKTKSNQQNAVLNAITAEIEFDIPKTLIQQELDFLVRQQVNFLEQQVDPTMLKQLFTKELVEEMRRLSYPEAITRIKRKIALDEIIKREGLQVDQVQLKEKVDNAMEYFREQGQSQTIDRKKLIAVVTEEILTENALDWLVENSEIELVAEGSLAEKAQPPQISETEVAPDGTVTIEATASDAE